VISPLSPLPASSPQNTILEGCCKNAVRGERSGTNMETVKKLLESISSIYFVLY